MLNLHTESVHENFVYMSLTKLCLGRLDTSFLQLLSLSCLIVRRGQAAGTCIFHMHSSQAGHTFTVCMSKALCGMCGQPSKNEPWRRKMKGMSCGKGVNV